jgi:hypothetical protein
MGEGPAPIAEKDLWTQLAGNHFFSFGKFDVLRTDHSIATFSWGRQTMGMAMPLSKDLLLTPYDRSLIGNVELDKGKRDVPKLVQAKVISPPQPGAPAPVAPFVPWPPNSFAIVGALDRGAGLIAQPFAFIALPDGRAIYVDSPKPLTTRIPPCEFGTIGILNEPQWIYHNGLRTIFFDKGEITFSGKEAPTADPANLSSTWYNIDRLGIVVLASSRHQFYNPRPTKAAGRLEQLFHLNHPMPGEDLHPTVLVFYPDQPWEKTRELAGICTFGQPTASQFVITLDDTRIIAIDFANLTIGYQ